MSADRSSASPSRPPAALADNPFDRSHVETDDAGLFARSLRPSPTGERSFHPPHVDPPSDNPFDRSHVAAPPPERVERARPVNDDSGLRSVDLTGRERGLREAMGILNKIASHFARAARRTLPFLVWRKSRLLPEAVSIARAPGHHQPPAGPTLHAVYDEEEGPGWASVSLNEISLGLILEGALGAAESTGPFKFGTELTLAQRAVSGRLIRALGDDLLESVRKELPVGLRLSGVFAGPTDSLDQVERADGLRVDCGVEGVPGASISIAVQAALLEAAGRPEEVEESHQNDPRMYLVVQEIPVDVVAELGRLALGLRSVLQLRVGQVLRLSTAVDDPVRVDVEGHRKFVGVPVVSRGQLAVEIKGRCGD